MSSSRGHRLPFLEIGKSSVRTPPSSATTVSCLLLSLVVLGCAPQEGGHSTQQLTCTTDSIMSNLRPEEGQAGLVVKACPEQTEVAYGSDVKVTVIVANLSSQSVKVPGRLLLDSEVGASVTGPSGKLQRLAVLDAHWGEPASDTVLRPDDYIERTINLSCPVRISKTRGDAAGDSVYGCVQYYDFGKPGKYDIEIEYRLQCPEGWCPPGMSSGTTIRTGTFRITRPAP